MLTKLTKPIYVAVFCLMMLGLQFSSCTTPSGEQANSGENTSTETTTTDDLTTTKKAVEREDVGSSGDDEYYVSFSYTDAEGNSQERQIKANDKGSGQYHEEKDITIIMAGDQNSSCSIILSGKGEKEYQLLTKYTDGGTMRIKSGDENFMSKSGTATISMYEYPGGVIAGTFSGTYMNLAKKDKPEEVEITDGKFRVKLPDSQPTPPAEGSK